MFVAGSVILACLMVYASAHPLLGSCSDPFEEYSECGSPCAPTCENPHPVCQESCRPGCYCRPGYMRHHGVCVISSRCGGYHRRHRKCGPNASFKRCRRACEPTCHCRKPRDCSDECIDFGCQCRAGFVRDRHDDCIPYDLCPGKNRRCWKNEYYSNETNVPDRKCQPRCPEIKYPSKCPRYTTNGGCVCKDTYIRNKRGRCVKPEECDHSSGSSDHSSHHHHHDSDSDSDSWSGSKSWGDSKSWDKSSHKWRRHYGRRRWHSTGSSISDECDCGRVYRHRSHCYSFCDRSHGYHGYRYRHHRLHSDSHDK